MTIRAFLRAELDHSGEAGEEGAFCGIAAHRGDMSFENKPKSDERLRSNSALDSLGCDIGTTRRHEKDSREAHSEL